MTGLFQGFELTNGSFGQQYTTIDGQVYLTRFDLCDPKLRGLRPGCRVEFNATAAPTILCHMPYVIEDLPSATLVASLPMDRDVTLRR